MSFRPSEEAGVSRAPQTIVSGSSGSAQKFDPLADLVVRRLWDAQQHRQSKSLADCTVEEVLGRCWRQRNLEYDPCDKALLDGIDIYVPLTEMKCVAAEAWLRDMLASVLDMPFTIDPTPIPELPEHMRRKVLRDLKMEIASAATGGDPLMAAKAFNRLAPAVADTAFGGMIAEYPGDLAELAGKLKEGAKALAYQQAKSASEKMGMLMRDHLIGMKFASTLELFFYDLATFPVACLKGPVIVRKPKMVWSGNSFTARMEPQVDAYRVSPFDLWPSADSPDGQRGTYVIELGRMTRRELKMVLGQKFWIDEHVKAILEEYRYYDRNWVVFSAGNSNLESPKTARALWGDDESIDVIEMHGILSGRELELYGFSAERRSFYEAKIIVCGGRTLYARVNGEAHMTMRPYHVTSYQKQGDSFWGLCPAMKLRDVQRICNSAVRAQVRNMAFSSGPLSEIELQRVKRYVTDLSELTRIEPYSVMLTDPDQAGGNRPARTFYNVPNILAPLLQTIQFYMKMADDVSSIPAYAQGDTGLGGAGRTYRGFSAVFSQALKVFKMPVQNMDRDIFEPFARALYYHLMATSTDQSVKGDAQVRARGSRGLVDMEQQQQKALEAMQVVTQMSPVIAEIDPEGAKKVLRFTWAKAMQGLGVPIEAFGVNPDLDAALGYTEAKNQDALNPSTIPPVNAETPPPQ